MTEPLWRKQLPLPFLVVYDALFIALGGWMIGRGNWWGWVLLPAAMVFLIGAVFLRGERETEENANG